MKSAAIPKLICLSTKWRTFQAAWKNRVFELPENHMKRPIFLTLLESWSHDGYESIWIIETVNDTLEFFSIWNLHIKFSCHSWKTAVGCSVLIEASVGPWQKWRHTCQCGIAEYKNEILSMNSRRPWVFNSLHYEFCTNNKWCNFKCKLFLYSAIPHWTLNFKSALAALKCSWIKSFHLYH